MGNSEGVGKESELKLDIQVRIGNTVFGKGTKVQTLINHAQRLSDYLKEELSKTPKR